MLPTSLSFKSNTEKKRFLCVFTKVLSDQQVLGKDRIQMHQVDDFDGVDLPRPSLKIPLNSLGVLRITFVLTMQNTYITF